MLEIVVDNFAGGGGASTGIEAALGRAIDAAINHDSEAVAMHAANHPDTEHFCQSVWRADPRDICRGRPVGLAWFSPDCKHFSKAKGGKPVKRNIRDLAWVIVHWAQLVRPRLIMLENVEEFRDWGPLVEVEGGKMMPCPLRKGLTYRRWKRELAKLGYKVEEKELRACDYGAPTSRKRLFVIARCDGEPIVWPAPTHGPGRAQPYRVAADIIDWSIPCPSIFDRKKPLAENTMRRIAAGIRRYVLDNPKPFIVPVNHQGDARVHGIDDPMRTITAAPRGEHALITPFMAPRYLEKDGHEPRTSSVEEPIRTLTPGGNAGMVVTPYIGRIGQTGGNGAYVKEADAPLTTITSKAEHLVITPFLAGCGGRAGQSPPKGADEPLNTVTAKADQILVAPVIIKQNFGEKPCLGVDEPLHTVTTQHNKHALVAPMIVPRYGERPGQEPRTHAVDQPAPTIVPTANGAQMVAAFLAQHNTGMVGHDVAEEPVSTIVQKGCTQALVTSSLINLKGSDRRDAPTDGPVPTQTAGGWHIGEVRAFLLKYFGTDQDPRIDEPLDTLTTKHRFGLVTVHGVEYQIVDIGMRMLTPRELFAAQGFPADYVLSPWVKTLDRKGRAKAKRLTKTAQVRMCGNSVCPPVAEALVRANYAERVVQVRPAKRRARAAEARGALL